MKTINVKNLQIQFDSLDANVDNNSAYNFLDDINAKLQEIFPEQSPQIFVSAIDDSDIEISTNDDEED